VQLIFSSTGQNDVNGLSGLLEQKDPKGMWEKLKRSDRSRDELFIANVRANFHKTHFTPEKQTIRQFVESLESFRMQVANTGKPITDDEMRDRLLSALPLDSGLWQQNRMWAIQQKADLEATISLLEQNEAIKPSGDADESAPIASYANNKEKIGPDGFTDRQRKQFESLLEIKRKSGKRRRGGQDYGDQSGLAMIHDFAYRSGLIPGS
jgi:ATP-dependent exoDNAse (exonuclease V) beta subunit